MEKVIYKNPEPYLIVNTCRYFIELTFPTELIRKVADSALQITADER